MRPRAAIAAFCGGLLIGGCTLEPAYRRPELPPLPVSFADASAEAQRVIDAQHWWAGFNDVELQALLLRAMRDSQDMKIAIDRVMAAQSSVTVARSKLLPVVGFTGLPTDPLTTQLRTASSGRLDVDNNVFEVSLNASYEIDLWGRIENGIRAAGAGYRADIADAGAVRIGLLSAVARAYFGLRELDERAQIEAQRADLAQQRLRLLSLRRDAGRIGSEPVDEARQAADEADARVAGLARERRLGLTTLALLVGAAPDGFLLETAPLRGRVSAPPPPEGLPSSLLERRPDIVAAESRLQAAHSQVAIAHSDLFPQLALTGKAGFVSGAVSGYLDTGSTVFGIGPDIAVPIFNAGSLRAELEASRWREDAAVQDYRKTVFTALADVQRALLGFQSSVEAQARSETALARHRQRLQGIDASLDAGRVSRLELIAAQDRALELDAASLTAYRARLDSLVAVYQSLGGGWSITELSPASVAAESPPSPTLNPTPTPAATEP